MDLNSVPLPEELFNTLKCYLCGRYLSVGPVISLTDDGKPYKCGRCKDIPSEKSIRNLCYEKVAAFLMFPCSYENCKVKLTWQEVDSHEKFCQHRIIQCVNNCCDTLIKIHDVENHFKLHTKRRVYFDSIKNLSIKKHCSVVLLLKTLMLRFFVVIRHYHETLFAGVFSLEPLQQKADFNLTITSDHPHSPSVSYKAEIKPYDDFIHCINCMRKKCNLSFHKFSSRYEHSGNNIDMLPLKINFEALETLLFAQSKPIYYSVNILFNDNEINPVSDESSDNSKCSEFQETDNTIECCEIDKEIKISALE